MMTLADRIGEEQIAQYERDGAILLKSVLDPAQMRLLEEGVEDAHANRSVRGATVQTAEGKGQTVVENYICARVPALKTLMESGVLAEIAGRIMRAPSAHLVLDQIFYKHQGTIVATPWHQDTPFLRVRGMDLVRLWIPCEFSPRDLTVQVVRGSHRWNIVYNTRTEGYDAETKIKSDLHDRSDFYAGHLGDSQAPLAPDVARYKDSFDIMSWDVEPGDALLFQGNMLHGTDGRDDHATARRAFACFMAGPDARYHVPNGKAFPPPGRAPSGISSLPIARLGDYERAFPAFWHAPG